jgi:hypothetical protein
MSLCTLWRHQGAQISTSIHSYPQNHMVWRITFHATTTFPWGLRRPQSWCEGFAPPEFERPRLLSAPVLRVSSLETTRYDNFTYIQRHSKLPSHEMYYQVYWNNDHSPHMYQKILFQVVHCYVSVISLTFLCIRQLWKIFIFSTKIFSADFYRFLH